MGSHTYKVGREKGMAEWGSHTHKDDREKGMAEWGTHTRVKGVWLAEWGHTQG